MLYTLKEQPDVFADAAIADAGNSLVFLSIFGRDTSLQQLFARLQLTRQEGGIDRVTVVKSDAEDLVLEVRDVNRLTKITGRLSVTLFGPLVHAWVFASDIVDPDRVNGRGWLLSRPGDEREAYSRRRWDLVKTLSPIPLHESWRDRLVDLLGPEVWTAPSSVGNIEAVRLDLPAALIESTVCSALLSGALPVSNIGDENTA